MTYLTIILQPSHVKNSFTCGNGLLDNYLRHLAGQDIKRKLSVTFVMVDSETQLVKGYYSLANFGIPAELLPPDTQKKLPGPYKTIPATLLGRLAVDNRFQGQGIGGLLLVDALKRSFEVAKSMGSFAVIVDPIDKSAEDFYNKYGFIKLPDSGKMFLPMKTIEKLFL